MDTKAKTAGIRRRISTATYLATGMRIFAVSKSVFLRMSHLHIVGLHYAVAY